MVYRQTGNANPCIGDTVMIFAHDKKTGRIRGKADIQTQPNPEPSRARSGAEGVETRGGRSVALNHPTRTRHAARREEIVQIRLV